MDVEEYRALGRSWKVQNDVGNQSHVFGNFRKYRLYRRLGISIDVQTSGNYLSLRNLALIVARARFGGRVMDAGAFSVSNNGQS